MARPLFILVFVALVALAMQRPVVAMGPMAGTERLPGAAITVTPESCMACSRAADPMACHKTAMALAAARDWDRAIAVEQLVHRAMPGNAEVAAVLARMYQEGPHNVPLAFELYHEALGAWPGYPPAILGLGSMLETMGHLDVAALYFERGARERPDEPQFKVRLATVLMKSGREDRARPLLAEVVERWPGSHEADDARKLMPTTALAKP